MSSVEVACNFIEMPSASSIEEAQVLAQAAIDAREPAYVIRAAAMAAIKAEVGPEETASAIFSDALGGEVVESGVTYVFSGRQPCNAHVDEVPEDLLPRNHYGTFNIHQVVAGEVSVAMVYTRPGYYNQGGQTREPITAFNFGITQDLQRRRDINTYTTESAIREARLAAGDSVVFFERTSPTVDGPPNVVHLFHQGTPDRCSQINGYYSLSMQQETQDSLVGTAAAN